MSARRRCGGFGLFEFLVVSLATAVIVGVIIGLITRADQGGQHGDRVSLGQPNGSEASSSAAGDPGQPSGTADRRPTVGNLELSPQSVGGLLCLPGTEDVA